MRAVAGIELPGNDGGCNRNRLDTQRAGAVRWNIFSFKEVNRMTHHRGPLTQYLYIAEHDNTRLQRMVSERQTQIRADTRWLTCGDSQQRQRAHSSGRSST